MFTFRRLTILFFILLMLLNLIHFLGCRYGLAGWHICTHIYIYMIILFGFYLSISVAMAFVIRSGFHYPAICSGNTPERVCSITFDDGPEPENTASILKILDRRQVPATFFIIGKKITGNERLIKEMYNRGHIIGNHSWSHSVWFDFFSSRRMRRELTDTADAIAGITGRSPLLFRPPYGVINPMLKKALKGLGYHVIGWNIRTFDTMTPDPQKVAVKIRNKLVPGSVILLHDVSSGGPNLLEVILDLLKLKGYSIIPLTELIQKQAYA